jgi:hypothetical protein
MDNSFDAKKVNENGYDFNICVSFSLGNFGIFVSGSKYYSLYSLSVLLLPKHQ